MLSWWFGIYPGRGGDIQRVHGGQSGSARWGVGKPLYQDLISRTKAALAEKSKNVLLAVCWMQGEFEHERRHPRTATCAVLQPC
ncbi:phage protein YjhS encoded within prophage CP-933O [Escherichia coli]|uniref:Phage protein YjhS encoded within prophage CP-933O n=1 Tax=Escherichia coli TaxID=562 RepID=A0A376UD49_ECOLX|nr:phage protein YjhS encoded within prophage CP-933O [Escherichia coli]